MAVTTQQKVQVVTEFITKNFKGFNTVMGQTMGQFKESTNASGNLNKRFKNMNNLGARLAHRTRIMTHGMRGFRMEMLGVMFFGMAFSRAMTGLLRTSLEWTGVMEVMSTALGILFLPVAELLLDWAISFLDWVSNLTEVQKKYIGSLVLLGIAFGTTLFLVGQFSLGIGSLIQVFGLLISPIGLVLAALIGITALIFGPQLIDWFSSLTDGIDGAEGKLATFGVSADVLGALKEKLASVDLGKFLEIGLNVLQKIVDGVLNNMDIVEDAVVTIASSLSEFVGKNIGKFIKIGFEIIRAIGVGLLQGAINVAIDLGNALSRKLGIKAQTQRVDLFQYKGALGRPPTPQSNFSPSGQAYESASLRMTVAPTYNVNVSDKREFEDMLRENNTAMAEDTLRLIQTR